MYRGICSFSLYENKTVSLLTDRPRRARATRCLAEAVFMLAHWKLLAESVQEEELEASEQSMLSVHTPLTFNSVDQFQCIVVRDGGNELFSVIKRCS
uniref:Uncharacterized protein n=1 Tax=Rhipicephalus zambeziensis TaxID=60191 RepID=A0A224Y9Q0_9ACAR